MLDKILEFIQKNEGTLTIAYDSNDGAWQTAVHFGREAEDSSMFAGAAYGIEKTLEEAIKSVEHQIGLDRV